MISTSVLFYDLITRYFKIEKKKKKGKNILRGKTEKDKSVSEDWVIMSLPFSGKACVTLELSHAKDRRPLDVNPIMIDLLNH